MVRNRVDIVVAAFAAAGPGVSFDPIRVQKLLFLIDRVVSERIGGPFFDFRPYRYGPFDSAIYGVIEEMVSAHDAQIDTSGPYPRYSLTEAGDARGEVVLASFPAPVTDYFGRAARWIRLMPYRRMLAAIYREYPEMAENSVVRHLGTDRPPPRSKPFIRGMTRAFDLTGTMYRSPETGKAARSNADAIHDAWRAVGEELEQAMTRFGGSEHLW